MGKREKLIKKLKSKPNDLTYNEMQGLLRYLGFEISNKGKTSGSRVKFFKNNIVIILHKPHPQKELKEYQVKHVIEILEREGLI